MPTMFQINEDDLIELERSLPQMADAISPNLDNRLRATIRRVQRIVTDVRWRYGPPKVVEQIDADNQIS